MIPLPRQGLRGFAPRIRLGSPVRRWRRLSDQHSALFSCARSGTATPAHGRYHVHIPWAMACRRRASTEAPRGIGPPRGRKAARLFIQRLYSRGAVGPVATPTWRNPVCPGPPEPVRTQPPRAPPHIAPQDPAHRDPTGPDPPQPAPAPCGRRGHRVHRGIATRRHAPCRTVLPVRG